MLCPYCNVTYTAEEPCFCQPAMKAQATQPEQATNKARVSDDHSFWSTTSKQDLRTLQLEPSR